MILFFLVQTLSTARAFVVTPHIKDSSVTIMQWYARVLTISANFFNDK